MATQKLMTVEEIIKAGSQLLKQGVQVRPPMGGDPELKNEPLSILPGHITYVNSQSPSPWRIVNPLAIFCGERFRRPDEIAQMDEAGRRAVATDIAAHRHDDDRAAGFVPLPRKSLPEEPRPFVPNKWGEH